MEDYNSRRLSKWSLTRVIAVANLRYHETLNHISTSTITKRVADDKDQIVKHVKFQAFSRLFHVTLEAGCRVLADDFNAQLVNERGESTPFVVDESKLFNGHLFDKPETYVSAHIEDDLWSIQIFEENETYAVEPALHFLNESENPNGDKFIAYRGSDLNDTGIRCEARQFNKTTSIEYQDSSTHHRDKRRVTGNTCVLAIVGDFDLYQHRCRYSSQACASIMINSVEYTDRIFRSSNFHGAKGDIYTNIGVLIGTMTLYTAPSESFRSEYVHFNAKDHAWDATSKLDSFAFYQQFVSKYYCVHHLFTAYPMPKQVLGLAFLGGLCGKIKGSVLTCTGVSSCMDTRYGPLTMLQIYLVFAHGHSFGSPHDDPDVDDCGGRDPENGRYLMWPSGSYGKRPNNKLFSLCSRKNIGWELEHSKCLLDKILTHSFCGNGVLNSGEDCDAGTTTVVGSDPCCNQNCKFKANSTCSDQNSQCCHDCKMAAKGKMCFDMQNMDCRSSSYCTGNSYTCPVGDIMPDFTPCIDGGKCYEGVCRSYCEIKSISTNLSLKSCMCTEEANACKWCCFNDSDHGHHRKCFPHSTGYVKDGRKCFLGVCEDGLCKPIHVSTIRRLYAYLEHYPKKELILFLRTNIVFIVVVLSLIVWIPAACIFSCLDRREEDVEHEIKIGGSRLLHKTTSSDIDYMYRFNSGLSVVDASYTGLGWSFSQRLIFDPIGSSVDPKQETPKPKALTFDVETQFNSRSARQRAKGKQPLTKQGSPQKRQLQGKPGTPKYGKQGKPSAAPLRQPVKSPGPSKQTSGNQAKKGKGIQSKHSPRKQTNLSPGNQPKQIQSSNKPNQNSGNQQILGSQFKPGLGNQAKQVPGNATNNNLGDQRKQDQGNQPNQNPKNQSNLNPGNRSSQRDWNQSNSNI